MELAIRLECLWLAFSLPNKKMVSSCILRVEEQQRQEQYYKSIGNNG